MTKKITRASMTIFLLFSASSALSAVTVWDVYFVNNTNKNFHIMNGIQGVAAGTDCIMTLYTDTDLKDDENQWQPTKVEIVPYKHYDASYNLEGIYLGHYEYSFEQYSKKSLFKPNQILHARCGEGLAFSGYSFYVITGANTYNDYEYERKYSGTLPETSGGAVEGPVVGTWYNKISLRNPYPQNQDHGYLVGFESPLIGQADIQGGSFIDGAWNPDNSDSYIEMFEESYGASIDLYNNKIGKQDIQQIFSEEEKVKDFNLNGEYVTLEYDFNQYTYYGTGSLYPDDRQKPLPLSSVWIPDPNEALLENSTVITSIGDSTAEHYIRIVVNKLPRSQ